MQRIEGLHQVLGAAAPAAQLRDQHRIDLPGLGKRHDLGALGAVVPGPRRGLLENADDVVLAALGVGPQITLLALAALVVGADAAVDGNLSHLNPLRSGLGEAQQIRGFRVLEKCIKLTVI